MRRFNGAYRGLGAALFLLTGRGNCGYILGMEKTKEERSRLIRRYLHDFGKLFLDITKLSFGSLVFGSIIKWDLSQITIFIAGLSIAVCSAVLGTVLVVSNEEKK